MFKNSRLPSSNLSISTSSLANAFTTLCPRSVSSIRAFSSPIWWRWRLKAARIFLLILRQTYVITGTNAKTITVSARFILERMINETVIFTAAIKSSSGQWCENSVMSKRSLVMRPIICPTLVLLKYVSESF